MDGTQAHVVTNQSEHATRFSGILGGSLLEAFGALATIALAVVGLAGVFSATLAAIATIVVGVATMVEGGAFDFRNRSTAFINTGRFSSNEGVAALEIQGGLTTLILGVLALLGVAPLTLLAVAVIALGATFLMSGRMLTGLAAGVLGILAVVTLPPLTLELVALLILGAGLLFGGAEPAARTVASHS